MELPRGGPVVGKKYTFGKFMVIVGKVTKDDGTESNEIPNSGVILTYVGQGPNETLRFKVEVTRIQPDAEGVTHIDIEPTYCMSRLVEYEPS